MPACEKQNSGKQERALGNVIINNARYADKSKQGESYKNNIGGYT